MGPGGNSVSATEAKLSKTEKSRPVLSENPSLMIYTRERSVACHAVGEAPATTLVYHRKPGWACLDDERSVRLVRTWSGG